MFSESNGGGFDLRVPMQQEIRVRFDDWEREVIGSLADLSVSGMSIQLGVQTTVGSRLLFDFKVPGSSVEVRGEGSVVWQRPAEGYAGSQDVGLAAMGVKFMALEAAHLEEVERIVRSESGLKTELQDADEELARLQVASKEEKKRSAEQLGAMWESVRENALERSKLERELRIAGNGETASPEESAEPEELEEAVGSREEELLAEIEALKVTVKELGSHDVRDQLQQTTFLWEAAELRVDQLSKSLKALQIELEEAKSAARSD